MSDLIFFKFMSENPAAKLTKMPSEQLKGFIPTMNQMGYMTTGLDPYSQAFVDNSSLLSLPALEIGAAYGVASIAALEKGAQIIANDLDEQHLKILWERTPESDRQRLKLLPGKFPHELMIAPNSIGATLICRVLHFFRPHELQDAVLKLFEWTAPGGRVFAITETPYVGNFKDFIPIYERNKKAGHPFPGFIEDVKAIDPERAPFLPEFIHFLDPDILGKLFMDAGFKIEKVSTIARSDFPPEIQLDGRESVGVIAIK